MVTGSRCVCSQKRIKYVKQKIGPTAIILMKYVDQEHTKLSIHWVIILVLVFMYVYQSNLMNFFKSILLIAFIKLPFCCQAWSGTWSSCCHFSINISVTSIFFHAFTQVTLKVKDLTEYVHLIRKRQIIWPIDLQPCCSQQSSKSVSNFAHDYFQV